MANPEHLEILSKGVNVWNTWRTEYRNVTPDLVGAKLSNGKFSYANFIGAKMTEVDLSHSELSFVQFDFARLQSANFKGARFGGTGLRDANLINSNLMEVKINYSDFAWARLKNANFSGSRIHGTNLSGAGLKGANFENSEIGFCVFGELDLSQVKGLDSVKQSGPSTIGFDTLYRSQGKIPEKFLRDAGVPEALINYLPSLLEAAQPIQWHSCFISYSTKDEEFAERLHARMRQAGLRVWLASEDMKGGDYFFEQIERAIQLHDRLLLVLSEDSIQSKWVEREIRKARKVERAEKRRKLFPITLTDYATLKKWECLDSDTGEDLAEEVRKYHIPDFSNWKNHDAFEKAFARLEKDLRTSIGK